MGDTVKLIIEIPKEDIAFIRKTSFIEDEKTIFKQTSSDRQGTMILFRLMDSIKNSTPLNDNYTVSNEYVDYQDRVGADMRGEY